MFTLGPWLRVGISNNRGDFGVGVKFIWSRYDTLTTYGMIPFFVCAIGLWFSDSDKQLENWMIGLGVSCVGNIILGLTCDKYF